jgi:hypothetical protein
MAEAAPKLLQIPRTLHSVDEAIGVAKQLKLDNILILSERDDGGLIFLCAPGDMTIATTNWLLDRMKKLLQDS